MRVPYKLRRPPAGAPGRRIAELAVSPGAPCISGPIADPTSVCPSDFSATLIAILASGESPLPGILAAFEGQCPVFDLAFLAALIASPIRDSAILPFIARGPPENCARLSSLGLFSVLFGALPDSFALVFEFLMSGRAVAPFLDSGGFSVMAWGSRYFPLEIARMFELICKSGDRFWRREIDFSLSKFMAGLAESADPEIRHFFLTGLDSLLPAAVEYFSDFIFSHFGALLDDCNEIPLLFSVLSKCSFASFPFETLSETIAPAMAEFLLSPDTELARSCLAVFVKCCEWMDGRAVLETVARLAADGDFATKEGAMWALVALIEVSPVEGLGMAIDCGAIELLCDGLEAGIGDRRYADALADLLASAVIVQRQTDRVTVAVERLSGLELDGFLTERIGAVIGDCEAIMRGDFECTPIGSSQI
jgi:hypothetical protein